jgi:hypothetical protein
MQPLDPTDRHRQLRRNLYRAQIKRISPMLARFSYELMVHSLANLNSIGYDDGIPMLLDDDPVFWDGVGAEAADTIAAAAIARAAHH